MICSDSDVDDDADVDTDSDSIVDSLLSKRSLKIQSSAANELMLKRKFF